MKTTRCLNLLIAFLLVFALAPVSPVAVSAAEGDGASWYRYQGEPSSYDEYGNEHHNCGPAVVAMAIKHALNVQVPIREVRAVIGKNGKGTGWYDLAGALNKWEVKYTGNITGVASIKDALARGNVAIVGLDMSKVAPGNDIDGASMDPGMRAGKYYTGVTGHFLIVKGISRDGEYFVTHDPNVWGEPGNAKYWYSDGTPKGLNRHYRIADIERAAFHGDGTATAGIEILAGKNRALSAEAYSYGQTSRKNFISNPSAENGAKGWAGRDDNVALSTTTKYTRFGAHSLLVRKQTDGRAATLHSAKLTPGSTYTFSTYARLDSGDEISNEVLKGWMFERVDDPNKIEDSKITETNRPEMTWEVAGDGWYRGYYAFTAKAKTGVYGVVSTEGVPLGAEYYLDGTQIEEGSEPTDFTELAPGKGAPAPVYNNLQNPSAETGSAGWLSRNNNVKLSTTDEVARFGSHSLMVRKAKDGRAASFQAAYLTPGEQYTFSVYARLDSGKPVMSKVIKGWLVQGVDKPEEVDSSKLTDKNRPNMVWEDAGEGWYRGHYTFKASGKSGLYGVVSLEALKKDDVFYLDGAQLTQGAHLYDYVGTVLDLEISSRANYLVNPGAEGETGGWDGFNGVLELSGSDKHVRYAKEALVVRKLMPGRAATFHPAYLAPGEPYTFSAYFRFADGSAVTGEKLRGWMYEGVDKPEKVAKDALTDDNRPEMKWEEAGDGWYRGHYTFKATKKEGLYGMVTSELIGPDTVYYVDGAQIEKGTEVHPYQDPSTYAQYTTLGRWDGSTLPALGPVYNAGVRNLGQTEYRKVNVARVYDLGFGPSDAARIERMIASLHPRSPLRGRGELILRLAQKFRVDPLLIAQWQLESGMGTTGLNVPGNGGNIIWEAARPYAATYGCTPGPSSLGHHWTACPDVESGLGLWFNYVGMRYQKSTHFGKYSNIYNPCSDPGNAKYGFPCGTRYANLIVGLLQAHAGPPSGEAAVDESQELATAWDNSWEADYVQLAPKPQSAPKDEDDGGTEGDDATDDGQDAPEPDGSEADDASGDEGTDQPSADGGDDAPADESGDADTAEKTDGTGANGEGDAESPDAQDAMEGDQDASQGSGDTDQDSSGNSDGDEQDAGVSDDQDQPEAAQSGESGTGDQDDTDPDEEDSPQSDGGEAP